MGIKFSEETVKKVADLARLQLSAEEVTKFTHQVGEILKYIEKLNTLDTTNVEPLSHALDLTSSLRSDEARPSPGADAMTESAPESLYENYKVPQVMGGQNGVGGAGA